MTKRRKVIVSIGMIVVLVLSISVTYLLGDKALDSVRELSSTLIPLVAGVIIGAVGVYLGSLSNLYTLISTKEEGTGISLESTIVKIDNTGHEIRDNVIFVLLAAITVEVIQAFHGIVLIPYPWIIGGEYFSQQNIGNGLVLGLTILSFYAVVDVVLGMFSIHQQYRALR